MVVQAYDPTSFRSFIDAALLEAEDGLAGEIGHLIVDASSLAIVNNGRGELPELSSEWICSCGQPGHLEAIAAGRGLVNRAQAVDDPQLREELGIPAEPEARNRTRDLLSEVTRAIDDDDDSHPALHRALRDAGRLIGHALAGAVLTLAPSSITFTGPAACAPLAQGFATGVNERGGFHGKRVALNVLSGEDNLFGPARGAALSLFRREIYRNFGFFERLQAKSGERQLRPDERLFSSKMRLTTPTDILRPKR
jgi:predicted NBD/HSP70 family sugar kinase